MNYHPENDTTPEEQAMWEDRAEKAGKGSGASPCSRCPDLNKEVEALRNAIRLASAKFDAVDWGWDGDCGSGRIIEELENILPENAELSQPTKED